MLNSPAYDIAIVGGGMVGLACAIGLAQASLNVVVIDAGGTQAVSGEPRLRVSAINKASQRLLEHLGAWGYVDMARATPYQKMAVWDKDGFGKIAFDAMSLCEPSLGTIIENDAISFALAKRASEFANITHIEHQRLGRIAFGEREAWLTLANSNNRGSDSNNHGSDSSANGGIDSVSAALVIAADGANSWVREQYQIPLTFWDYGHHAIVATIRSDMPHLATARQVFLPEGPLAFLPLYEDNLCSIVWSLPPERASELMAMAPEQFGRELTAAFDGRLGICKLESERQAFPLRMR
ncbi:MAG: FAD-dependent oxidoreductase, partial [Shewanella sp.]